MKFPPRLTSNAINGVEHPCRTNGRIVPIFAAMLRALAHCFRWKYQSRTDHIAFAEFAFSIRIPSVAVLTCVPAAIFPIGREAIVPDVKRNHVTEKMEIKK